MEVICCHFIFKVIIFHNSEYNSLVGRDHLAQAIIYPGLVLAVIDLTVES